MKVFISSVTHLLKDERNALPPFLRLLDHQPLRFEDFESQDRSAREACLAGVDAADVYVLLLGPKYGTPFADSGLAPTAEEFRLARNRGIPILVFDKVVEETSEPGQQAFKAEVGHYVNGRLWRTFTDPLSLNQAVGEALKALPSPSGPLVLHPLDQPGPVTWLDPARSTNSRVTAPILEVHLVPIGATMLTSATSLAETATVLARDARSMGFVAEADPLTTGSDNHGAWAVQPPNSEGGWQRTTTEAFRGVPITATGDAAAYLTLPTDMFGALVDQPSLKRDIGQLIGLITPHVPPAEGIAPAVALSGAERVWEGDPADVGTRSSGTMRTTRGQTITLDPTFYVRADDITRATGELAAEMAMRLLNEIRALRTY